MCPGIGLGEESVGILKAMLLGGTWYGQLCIAELITSRRLGLAQDWRTLLH